MNKSYIDLHMHSLYSDDGEFTPTQLVEMCHEAGVKIMAIADHNWVKAIDEAKKKAEEVLKKAKSGEEFSELAKEYSDDPGSAANGGDLGYFTKGQMVQPFEEAAFSLKSGEISGLVESEYGYHIIKVYDKIDKQLTFDEVKDEIKKTLTEDKYMESIEAITKKAKVEKNESVIKKVKF